MVGMTNRVNFSSAVGASILAVTWGILGLSPALALASDIGQIVPDALVASLDGNDLAALGHGLETGLLSEPISGHTDARVEESGWLSTVGIAGASYSFRLKDLSLTPHNGRLSVHVSIKDLAINVDKIYFGRSEAYYCNDMPLTSNGATIPVTADVTPHVAGRSLDVSASAAHVGLTGANYDAGEPAACHIFFGASWLVRHTLPYVAALLRPAIEQAVENRLTNVVQELGGTINNYLNIAITLPFDLKPVPAFYGSLALWPSSVMLSEGRAQLKLGADLNFDPDSGPRVMKHGSLIFAEKARKTLALLEPSWLGLSRSLFAAFVNEANAKGLLNADFTQANLPRAQDLMLAQNLAAFLPDAAARFAPADQVGFGLAGADDTGVIFNPDGPGGIPIIDVVLTGLAVNLTVKDAPYYQLKLNLRAGFKAGLDPIDHKLVLALNDFDTAYANGNFAAGLQPAPVDASFHSDLFAEFMTQFENQLRGDRADFFAIELPDLAFGDQVLKFLGSSVREDYVTLDAMITSGPRAF